MRRCFEDMVVECCQSERRSVQQRRDLVQPRCDFEIGLLESCDRARWMALVFGGRTTSHRVYKRTRAEAHSGFVRPWCVASLWKNIGRFGYIGIPSVHLSKLGGWRELLFHLVVSDLFLRAPSPPRLDPDDGDIDRRDLFPTDLSTGLSHTFVDTSSSMGRKKRGGNQVNGQQPPPPEAKRAKPETGESYLVKKYRMDKHYPALEAFASYTKTHRMSDATYVRWSAGATEEKPYVFATRVGGMELGWGRGRTRDAAIDCSVRAAFSLVGAHGYKNFPLDDDCLLEAPIELMPPPPPPPPPPGALPPPPLGIPLPPQPQDLIPQPQLPTTAPIASSLMTSKTQTEPSVSLSFRSPKRQELKGGLTLVFAGAVDGEEEMSMEELRAQLPRYQKPLKTLS